MRRQLDGPRRVLQAPSHDDDRSCRPRTSQPLGRNTRSRGAKRDPSAGSPSKTSIPPIVLGIGEEAETGWEYRKLHPIWLAPDNGKS
jgi:hypothetical protein